MTGKDSTVDIALFMGDGGTTSRAVVQSTGQAYQLNSAILKQELIANMLGVCREGVTEAAGRL